MDNNKKKIDYKITYINDNNIKNVHYIRVHLNGNYYDVIFGRYINGGFCSIPNWGTGCELVRFSDIFWNAESLSKALSDKKVGKAIAIAIAEAAKTYMPC